MVTHDVYKADVAIDHIGGSLGKLNEMSGGSVADNLDTLLSSTLCDTLLYCIALHTLLHCHITYSVADSLDTLLWAAACVIQYYIALHCIHCYICYTATLLHRIQCG